MSGIAIIDYGVGNLFSLCSSLDCLGLEHWVTRSPEEIAAADRIILPGVGAFGDAMEKLEGLKLTGLLREQAARGKPLLGICLGMQLLFEKSCEYGEHLGLNLLPGQVRPLAEDLGPEWKIPEMGWNSLRIRRPHPVLDQVREGDYVYYVHSYYAKDCGTCLIASSDYGVEVPGVVAGGSVVGTQFHPEKSGAAGLSILAGFARFQPEGGVEP